ncbi:MAG: RecX family transcriptional regulator [Clostridiales bacterium]|jgi:regulatory protein|nr:RecX family transcriptional regulator [Clostridiales bacterium]
MMDKLNNSIGCIPPEYFPEKTTRVGECKPSTGNKLMVTFSDGNVEEYSPEEVIKYCLYENNEINCTFVELNQKIFSERAYSKALSFVLTGRKTVRQTEEKLCNLGFTAEEIKYAIENLSEKEYLNDRNYCMKNIKIMQGLRKLSRKKIKYTLLQKGISENLVDECLNEFIVNEEESILNIISTRYKVDINELNSDSLQDAEERKKIKRYLYNKGFCLETITKIVGGCE